MTFQFASRRLVKRQEFRMGSLNPNLHVYAFNIRIGKCVPNVEMGGSFSVSINGENNYSRHFHTRFSMPTQNDNDVQHSLHVDNRFFHSKLTYGHLPREYGSNGIVMNSFKRKLNASNPKKFDRLSYNDFMRQHYSTSNKNHDDSNDLNTSDRKDCASIQNTDSMSKDRHTVEPSQGNIDPNIVSEELTSFTNTNARKDPNMNGRNEGQTLHHDSDAVTTEKKVYHGMTEQDLRAYQSIRQSQREAFQRASILKETNTVSPFIPISKSVVAKPNAPSAPTLRPNESTSYPASFLFKEAALYLFEKHPNIQTQKARQHLFFILSMISSVLLVIILTYIYNNEAKAIFSNITHLFANGRFNGFYVDRLNIDRLFGLDEWLHHWLEDKYDPFPLLLLGEEPGVGKRWFLKKFLGNRNQIVDVDVGTGEIPIHKIIMKKIFGESIAKHINLPPEHLNEGLQYISFCCSDEITPASLMVIDLTKVHPSYFEDRLWEAIDIFHESNDLYPQEIVQVHRGGIDVNSYIHPSNPKPYVGPEMDSRFNTGLKFIILAHVDQLQTCDKVRVCTFAHFFVLPRFSPFEASQILSKRGILLGEENSKIRIELFEQFPEIGLNGRELFRFCNYMERQARIQKTLVEKRRQLKKQLSILNNVDLLRDREALTTEDNSEFTDNAFSTITDDITKYTDEERQLHMDVLEEELQEIRNQIKPVEERVQTYLCGRKEFLKKREASQQA